MLQLLERQIVEMRKNYRSDLTQSISPYLARQHSLPIGILVSRMVEMLHCSKRLFFLSAE